MDNQEDWFRQQNKYKYHEVMCIMSKKDCTTAKAIHQRLKGSGKWIDLKMFVKTNKQFNPNGLFELFSSFRSQSADEVRDCLMGWIYDNFNKVKSWLQMALEHKTLNINHCIEHMRKSTSHGDDVALFLFCRMYDKHAYVHTAEYGWSTLPYKITMPVS